MRCSFTNIVRRVFLFAMIGALLPGWLPAQSSVVSVPGSPGDRLGQSTSLNNNPWVTISLDENLQNWESILAQAHTNISGQMTVADLMSRLAAIGLPVLLDQSAIDDSCDSDAQVVIANEPLTLHRRISDALRKQNASLVYARNRLLIASMDVIEDPEYFCTISYDVTGFGVDPRELDYNIRNLVRPDSWDDHNGDGVLSLLKVKGRWVMTIAQNYDCQLEIRSLMSSIQKVVSNSVPVGPTAQKNGLRGSSVVDVPSERPSAIPRRTPMPLGGIF